MSARRLLALALLFVLPGTAFAGEEERVAAILARAFSYDYSLKARAGDSVTLAVVYREGNGTSDSSAATWMKAFKTLEGVKVQGLPFSVVKVPYDASAKLKTELSGHGADIVFVSDGMDADLAAVAEVCRGLKLLSVGIKGQYVEQGLSLGVFNEGGKNTIVVNLGAASQEGVNFGSDLLRLARVIR